MVAILIFYHNGYEVGELGRVRAGISDPLLKIAIDRATTESRKFGCDEKSDGSIKVSIDGKQVWDSRSLPYVGDVYV